MFHLILTRRTAWAGFPQLVARFKGKKAIFFRHRAAFMWSVFLNGFENLLMNFLLRA